jgi:hypothetical protein
MLRTLPVVATVLLLAGCVSSGIFEANQQTRVGLDQANFRIVATNVHGDAQAGYILGFSWANGHEPKTVALQRVDGEGMLVASAMANLWDNFEAEYGPVEGRNLALINVRFDSDAANYLLLYTKQVITVRADVVEFIGTD